MKPILYAHQFISSGDIKEVVKVLKSDWITQGPRVKEFEELLYKYTKAKYAVAVSSGTAALHLSMMALNVSKGDEIITSPITFSASANCAIYVGAKPQFIDVDDKTYHLDIEKLKDFLRVPSQRRKVKVVIPVHFMGTVVDIAEINKICDKYGIKIVEDAAHALGAKYKFEGKWIKVGGCRHSNATIFSFHPIKHITTGEGGAVLTNNKKIYEKVLRLRHHGIIKNYKEFINKRNNPYDLQLDSHQWSYDIPQVGFNYRITDFQCALGISQLKKLDKIVEIRRELVKIYNEQLSDVGGMKLPYERKGTNASYHLYVIRVPENKRNKLYTYLRNDNILTQVNYIPVHLFSYYRRKFGYKWGDFPVAEKYFRECLSLPLHPRLSYTQQLKVINTLKRFFRG